MSAFVSAAVSKNAVVMFATKSCPFCHRASTILGRVTSDVRTYYIDSMDNGDDVFDVIEKQFQHSTVPAIFVKGTFVGGCDDMEELNASGQLQKMLESS